MRHKGWKLATPVIVGKSIRLISGVELGDFDRTYVRRNAPIASELVARATIGGCG
jgi:hypothetical protein